jgi:hypothetical protein
MPMPSQVSFSIKRSIGIASALELTDKIPQNIDNIKLIKLNRLLLKNTVLFTPRVSLFGAKIRVTKMHQASTI